MKQSKSSIPNVVGQWKYAIVLSAIAFLTAPFAHADIFYFDGGRPDEDSGHHHCSPEIINNNLQIADATLKSLAKAPNFQEAAVFQLRVKDILAQTDSRVKVDEYYKLMGIGNPKNHAEVLGILYAREMPNSFLVAANTNLNLNKDQATLLFNSLSKALKSNR